MSEAQELIDNWQAALIRLANKDYQGKGEFWALLNSLMEIRADLISLGYQCLDGQWIALAEVN